MEQNTQKLWYISKGISITAVPGGKKKEKEDIFKGIVTEFSKVNDIHKTQIQKYKRPISIH